MEIAIPSSGVSMRWVFLVMSVLFLLGVVGECAEKPLYFDSPEKAVTVITDLLNKKDWKTLTRYYDLTGSNLKRDVLESGDYFFGTQKPPPDYYTGPDHRQPFMPGYRFVRVNDTWEQDVIRVAVSMAVDNPKHVAEAWFFLRKSAAGYQVVPPEGIHSG